MAIRKLEVGTMRETISFTVILDPLFIIMEQMVLLRIYILGVLLQKKENLLSSNAY